MKNVKLKLAAAILSALMLGGIFSGCKKTDTKQVDADKSGLKPVTLKFYFFGDKRAETDNVWNTIADKYKDKLNVKFDIGFIPGSDYANKIVVMAASGDKWDMNFDGDWLSYASMINKGGYLPLNDLLPKYAPNLYSVYQKNNSLGAATVNGKIMALPWTMKMSQRVFMRWRGDLADKAGLDTKNLKTLEDWDKFAHDMHKAYPDLKGTKSVTVDPFAVRDGLASLSFHNLYFAVDDASCKVIPIEQTKAYKDTALMAKKWYDDGLIYKDAAVDKTDTNQLWREGKMLLGNSWHEWVYAEESFTDKSFKNAGTVFYPDKKAINRTALANVMAINKNAANPERTLMFMDLLETDKALYDLVQYGIEGKTYVLDGNRANYPAGITGANSNYMEWGGQWALWKPQFMRPNPSYPEGFWQKEAEFASLPVNVPSPLDGLFFDTTNIKNEIAKRDQIYDEYNNQIIYGIEKDPNKTVEEFIQKEKDAGIDKIVAEVQKQIDTYLASKKK